MAEAGEIGPDPAQEAALPQLDALCARVSAGAGRSAPERVLGLLRNGSGAPGVRGLYLWGGVGRGKTMLMDLAVQALPPPLVWRTHFNTVMDWMHTRLAQLQRQPDPLARLAREMGRRCRLLCLDEFFVEDIADAMLLGRFLQVLLREEGVALFATSNTGPDALYAEGLQRGRFLPAIAMLRECCQVVQMGGGEDWRLRMDPSTADRWLVDPRLAEAAGEGEGEGAPRVSGGQEKNFRALVEALGGGASKACDIEVRGRSLRGNRAGQAVWFHFAELCERPTGYRDYIALGEGFRALGLLGVPHLDAHGDDAARRLIALIDQLYSCGTPLVALAATEPGGLYGGTRLRQPMARALSRLEEMRHSSWPRGASDEGGQVAETPPDA